MTNDVDDGKMYALNWEEQIGICYFQRKWGNGNQVFPWKPMKFNVKENSSSRVDVSI